MANASSPQRAQFSQQDRIYISRTVSALVSVQFNELVFSLSAPPGVIPEQGDRAYALLQWVESPTGPGLEAIEDYLQSVIPKYRRVSKHFMTITLPVDYTSLTDEQKSQIVNNLEEIIGVKVDLFEQGSVKITVSGSEDEFKKLWKLFKRNHLSPVLNNLPIESVRELPSDTPTARKVRLIEMLRFRSDLARARAFDLAFDRASTSASVLVSALERVFPGAVDLDQGLGQGRDLAGTYTSANSIASVLNRENLSNSDLNIASVRAHLIASALARALDLDPGRSNDISRALDRANDLASNLGRALDLGRDRDIAVALSLSLDLNFDLNLRNTDLSGANLKEFYLVGMNLTGTNFVDALVEGTIFGDNPGLAESDKVDLISRGAIFHDKPGADVLLGAPVRL